MTRTYYDVLTVHTHTFLIRYMNFVHDKRKGKEKKNCVILTSFLFSYFYSVISYFLIYFVFIN